MNVKKITAQLGFTGFMAMALVLTVPTAQAFGLPKVPSLGASSEKSSGVDVASLMSQQKDLMGRFNQSMNNMLTAQSLTLAAGGLKEQADLALATAANYKEGTVQSKEALERDSKITADGTKAIEELMKNKTALTADGQKKLLSAVPHYAKGMADGSKLPKAFQDWTGSAKNGVSSLKTNPMGASKLTGGLTDATTVLTNLPSLMVAWTNTSKAFISYAGSNKVNTKDLSSAMGDL